MNRREAHRILGDLLDQVLPGDECYQALNALSSTERLDTDAVKAAYADCEDQLDLVQDDYIARGSVTGDHMLALERAKEKIRARRREVTGE